MENIKACIRIKPAPPNKIEEIVCGKYDESSAENMMRRQSLITKPMKNTNLVSRSSKFVIQRILLEHVFDERTTTEQIFQKVGENLIESCFQGINGNWIKIEPTLS
mgnify:CR=1 FL=1